MSIRQVTRRGFTWVTAGALAVVANRSFAQTQTPGDAAPAAPAGPTEAPFERDYDAPSFKPSWKKPQINRQMAQDFVIYAHSDLDKVKMLLEREAGLLNATIDWGNGDWETGLGGASHMGRHDIVEYLLSKGARPDIFCCAMLGQTEVIKSLLTLQPSLIDAKGPHGFSLHMHAQAGSDRSKETLDYLQSIKHLDLKPLPFLKNNK